MPAQRRQPAHAIPLERHNRATIVFLTVCTKDRKPRLANERAHKVLRQIWAYAKTWLVGRYVILPDHLHLFCAPQVGSVSTLGTWVGYWKRLVSQELGYNKAHPLWQQNFWDTQLRRHESYATKWDYVRHNPVRHGLVDQADVWPYQGELNVLEWHD